MTLPMLELVLRRHRVGETRRALAMLDVHAHIQSAVWSEKGGSGLKRLREEMQAFVSRGGLPEPEGIAVDDIAKQLLSGLSGR